MGFGLCGVIGGILLLLIWNSNLVVTSTTETVLGGQFDWGGRLPKCNGGAQRYPQIGWKSIVERNCRRVLDCKTYKSSRDESRK